LRGIKKNKFVWVTPDATENSEVIAIESKVVESDTLLWTKAELAVT
jgi:hypothetical protein